jgi:hypothetical protein
MGLRESTLELYRHTYERWPMNRIDMRSTTLDAVRNHLQARREARLRRLALERDLALYRSERDLNELYEMLSRHDDSETVAIRDIVARNRAA